MPVKIRLSLHGCTNRPFYHIVVASSKFKRDGRHLEQVGCYDPMPNNRGEVVVGLNMERIKYWLSVGAQPTIPVYKLLGMSGFLQLPAHPRLYLEASRARAQAKAAAQAKVDDNSTENSEQPSNSEES